MCSFSGSSERLGEQGWIRLTPPGVEKGSLGGPSSGLGTGAPGRLCFLSAPMLEK